MVFDQHEDDCKPLIRPCRFCLMAEFLRKELVPAKLAELQRILEAELPAEALPVSQKAARIAELRNKIIIAIEQHHELCGADLLKLVEGLPRGSIYTTLSRMEEDGWLKSMHEKVPGEKGPPRRYFRLTAKGQLEAKHLHDKEGLS